MARAEAERCLNCAGSLCRDVCPYGSPQFGDEENAKMQKCNFCIDRWAENKLPICVAACPLRALDAGPVEASGSEVRQGPGDGRIRPLASHQPAHCLQAEEEVTPPASCAAREARRRGRPKLVRGGRERSPYGRFLAVSFGIPAVQPPSTKDVVPVTNEESSEARYSATLATSSG